MRSRMAMYHILGALTVSAGGGVSYADAPLAVNVKDCYNGTPFDNVALHNAVGVAQGTTAGFENPVGTRCGLPGQSVYIGTVVIPPKSFGTYYNLSTELQIDRSLTIRGVQGGASGIRASSASMVMVRIKTVHPVLIADLDLVHSGSGQTGGAAVYIEGSSSADQNIGTTLERLTLNAMYIGVHVQAAQQLTIRDCFIAEPRAYGILHRNVVNGDHGDNTIEGNWITGAYPSSIGVEYESGGGLRMINNKIRGNGSGTMAIGFRMAWDSNFGSGDLIITGNSIEGQTDRGIQLVRNGATKFGAIVISGNQIGAGVTLGGVGIEVYDAYADDLDALRIASITGNVLHGWAWGIILYEADGFFIGNNVIAGSGGGGNGISLSAPPGKTRDVKIGSNTFTDLATTVTNCTADRSCTLCCANCN